MDEKENVNNEAKTKDTGSTVSRNALIVAIVVVLLISFPAGYALGNMSTDDTSTIETTEMTESMDTSDHSHADETDMDDSHSDDDMTSHMHEAYEVPEGVDAPTITMIEVTKDSKSGWNLQIMTENFTFTPENASGTHVESEGHAHLYIDGKKITRLYSNYYYIGELSEGEHTVRVTLNTNDHKDYTVNGEVVEASSVITDMHHSE